MILRSKNHYLNRNLRDKISNSQRIGRIDMTRRRSSMSKDKKVIMLANLCDHIIRFTES